MLDVEPSSTLRCGNRLVEFCSKVLHLAVRLYGCETWSVTLRGKNVGSGLSRIGC